jgi:seryl-tRNA synthetase
MSLHQNAVTGLSLGENASMKFDLNVWLPFLRWWPRVNRTTTRADFAPAAFAASRLSLLF